MKYYSRAKPQSIFDLHDPLEMLSKKNRWVQLADRLPWDKIEKSYNKRLKNHAQGAWNKPAHMVIGALMIKHIEGLSDQKTIDVIKENPYMQYFVGLRVFAEDEIFSPELFVSIKNRLNKDFFNELTLMLHDGSAKCDEKLKKNDRKKDSDSKKDDGENRDNSHVLFPCKKFDKVP